MVCILNSKYSPQKWITVDRTASTNHYTNAKISGCFQFLVYIISKRLHPAICEKKRQTFEHEQLLEPNHPASQNTYS